jgi:hypothetical protein
MKLKNKKCNFQDLIERPTIYSPNARETSVKNGDRFVLECVARGNPVPNIRIATPNRPSSRVSATLLSRMPQVKIDLNLMISLILTLNINFVQRLFFKLNIHTYLCLIDPTHVLFYKFSI